jgi:hypothetical protein
VSQTSLITDAARQALLDAVAQLGIDINAHTNGDIDQHDSQVLLNQPFVSDAGDVLSSKTLKIGIVYNNVNAYIFIPAL